ncbi:MAG: hypothetical protein ABI333_15885 [bacterium]
MRGKHWALIVMLAPVLLLAGESQGVPQRASADEAPARGPDISISPVRGLTLSPVPPGMGDDETLTLPRKGEDYDFDGLRSALVKLRATYGKLPPAFVSPGKSIPWWVVVHTIETTRKTTNGKPLFPVVFLGLQQSEERGGR